jgi:hypothetical protein
MGGGGGETAKAAAKAARAAGSETPGLELPWEAGKAVYRKLLRWVCARSLSRAVCMGFLPQEETGEVLGVRRASGRPDSVALAIK